MPCGGGAGGGRVMGPVLGRMVLWKWAVGLQIKMQVTEFNLNFR